MKLRPCPKCQCTDIKTDDCGYTTFNPGWATCTQCHYTVNAIPYVEGPDDPVIMNEWNFITDGEKLKQARRISRLLRIQLRAADLTPVT